MRALFITDAFDNCVRGVLSGNEFQNIMCTISHNWSQLTTRIVRTYGPFDPEFTFPRACEAYCADFPVSYRW